METLNKDPKSVRAFPSGSFLMMGLLVILFTLVGNSYQSFLDSLYFEISPLIFLGSVFSELPVFLFILLTSLTISHLLENYKFFENSNGVKKGNYQFLSTYYLPDSLLSSL